MTRPKCRFRVNGIDHFEDQAYTPPPMGLDDLITEARSAETRDLDLRSTDQLVELMNRQDTAVPAAVASQVADIAAAVDAIVERLQVGGRLVYVGAGTSGRLAEVD